MNNKNFPTFSYDINSGPVEVGLLDSMPVQGNCRTAIQYYFYIFNNIKFPPDKILCPQSYKATGVLVTADFSDAKWTQLLKTGDVFFAERIRSKAGESIDRSRSEFESEDDYITYLHTAIYIGDHKIWHATAITGTTCTWTLEEFQHFYKVVAVKRFIDFH